MVTFSQIRLNQGWPSWSRWSRTSTLLSPELPCSAVLCVGRGESDPLPIAVLCFVVWVSRRCCRCPVSQRLPWEPLFHLLDLILLSMGLPAHSQPSFAHPFPLHQLNKTLPFSQNKATVKGTRTSRVLDKREYCLVSTHRKQLSVSSGLV